MLGQICSPASAIAIDLDYCDAVVQTTASRLDFLLLGVRLSSRSDKPEVLETFLNDFKAAPHIQVGPVAVKPDNLTEISTRDRLLFFSFQAGTLHWEIEGDLDAQDVLADAQEQWRRVKPFRPSPEIEPDRCIQAETADWKIDADDLVAIVQAKDPSGEEVVCFITTDKRTEKHPVPEGLDPKAVYADVVLQWRSLRGW